MKSIHILVLIAVYAESTAQISVQGEYYFNRHEMVAGFDFSPDGKFQFFYSYGAVDRNASGTFTVEGNIIKLKSDKAAGQDFTVKQQSKKGKGYMLIFEHSNTFLLKNIWCIFFVDGKRQEAYSDSQGKVQINLDRCDSIFVQHSLYPDVVTRIKDVRNANNRFVLSLNPSLELVSFKGIDLTIVNENTLTCLPNYLIKTEDIKFVKQ